MLIENITAKNGSKTLKINSIFYHSAYNPQNEAERFVNSLEVPLKPINIVIIEPGLGYCIPYFKDKFPSARIIVIKLINTEISYQPDLLINSSTNFDELQIYLSSLSETEIFNTYFCQWPQATKIFENKISQINSYLKEYYNKAKTLLITSEYFEKKWFLNFINFVSFLKKTANLQFINQDILICASGPSLAPVLSYITNNTNKFFIVCLSSAYSVLYKNNIKPDLIISTDGGYWAGEHIKEITFNNIPLAISLESYVPKNILQNNLIIPLLYEDSLSSNTAKKMQINFEKAERNGTVSGTALSFLINKCNKKNNIYFAGLDLSSQQGFQHTQPNNLEINNSVKDNRIHTKEKRLYPGSLKNSSLDIYKDWFSSLKINNRNVYRIIDNKFKKNDLGQIIDLSSDDFIKLTEKNSSCNKNYFCNIIERDQNLINEEKKLCYSDIEILLKNEDFIKKMFPLSYISLQHNNNNTQILENIKKESQKILKKAGRILYE